MDPLNFFLLESTKRWIQLIYFCSDQQTVDSVICFYCSQQNDKFISAVTTFFQEVDFGVFISPLKFILYKKVQKAL
jgi:hypothetical protein